MAALSDPSVLDIQDKAKQARAAAEVEAYNSAVRAEAFRRSAEQFTPVTWGQAAEVPLNQTV